VHWIYAGFVGILVGAAVGLGALQLRVSPLVQSVAAVLVATLLSTGLTLFLWLRYPVLLGAAGDRFGVGVGVGVENALYLGALLVLGRRARSPGQIRDNGCRPFRREPARSSWDKFGTIVRGFG
jgi:hypothetical protein